MRPPKGMFWRTGRGYYCRVYQGGKERWVALGKEFDVALKKFKETRFQPERDERVLVRDLIERWLRVYIATARNEKGQKLARRRTEVYFDPFFGSCAVGSVRPEDLRRYRLHLEQRVSRQSTVHILSDARCFFLWAKDCGYIRSAPVPRRLLPRLQERPPDRLTSEEADAVMAIPEPWAFYVRLALGTGLRWSELCRTHASDVTEGCLVVHQTKSGKVRRVPLAPQLQAELRGRLGRLFPYSTKASGAFATVVQGHSGVERFHIHQLRHTFACRWLEMGGSLAALQQILGHSTIVVTQRYARLGDDLVKAEANRVYRSQTVASDKSAAS